MDNKNRNDVGKSLEKTSLTRSYANDKVFDVVDKSSQKIYDFYATKKQEKLDQEEQEKNETEEKETSDESENEVEEPKEEYQSRLKTNTQNEGEVNSSSFESKSKLKTNVNNKGQSSQNKEDGVSQSKLKTNTAGKSETVSSSIPKSNKVTKAISKVNKIEKKVSKTGRKITRFSKDLEKAVSSDGTGQDYLKTSAKRKTKSVANKTIVKPVKKQVKKVTNKAFAPLKKKLLSPIKALMKKALKMIITFVVSNAEFILPVVFIVVAIISITSIFGGGGSSKSAITSYQTYMNSVQAEYDKQVDDFLRENPKGIVVGVNGGYGKINWRVPLSILQGTGADITFDNSEKTILNQFKEAGLFEKHEIIEQKSISDDEFETETTTKMMIIINPGYSDYIDWINNNFSYMKTFMLNKNVAPLGNSFDVVQTEVIDLLYKSETLFDEFESPYKDYVVKYGSAPANSDLKSDNYNSKNFLTQAGYKGQCTWYAFGRALEVSGKIMPSGNAQTWLSSAIAMGLETGSTPSKNSVVVLAGNTFGHVAFVESYDGTSITISEGNVGNPCSKKSAGCSQVEYANNHANEMVRTKTYSSFKAYQDASRSYGQYIVGFIYLD